MSVIFKSKDGKEIDIKKDMKIIKLPNGGMAYESISTAIPRILKKKYPKTYYKEYQTLISERKKKLHNMHMNIQRK